MIGRALLFSLLAFTASFAQAQFRCEDLWAQAPLATNLSELHIQQKLLQEGQIVADWNADHSAFGAKFVRYADGTLGVWKAGNEKYHTLRHELAAARLAQHLEIFNVPATVAKFYNRVEGTVQWVAGATKNKRFASMLEELGFLDYLIDNRDRHGNNSLQTESGTIVAIDHGLAFGELGNLESTQGFESFERSVRQLSDLKKSRPTDALQKLQEAKLTSSIQIFAPQRSVLLKLKNTSRSDWEKVFEDSITSEELTALISRQERLVQSFDSAEALLGPALIYRDGDFSPITGEVYVEPPPPRPAVQLQNMKNRRAFGEF